MDVFLKTSAAVLITVVICLTVAKQGKDFSVLIAISGCCLVILAAATYLKPVISFIDKLQSIGDLDNDLIHVLLKAVGIGMLSEITGMICSDAGNASLGKTLQILAAAVILWLSLPIFTQLLELLENILGAL